MTRTGNGKWNGGYSFDGSDDSINAGSGVSLDITGAITVVAWVKAGTQSAKGIISKMVSNVNTRSWAVYSATSDKITVIITQNGLYPTNAKLYTTSIPVLNNLRHQVSFTFISQTLKIYVDGIEDIGVTKTTDNSVTSLYSNPSVNVTIGSFSLPSDPFS